MQGYRYEKGPFQPLHNAAWKIVLVAIERGTQDH